ncbi:Rha family transcriptional regulator [Acinetobacter vivianii]|uniref:Rha family transcriptional regulator n=1 Tax=Acinetobacter vivianii TaxID=1776742 RepID=UPI0040422FF0
MQIAISLGLQHASVIKLVRTYRPDFADLGPIRFEIRKGEALQHGGYAKATEYAVLDEQQATFLMTLLRNSPRVIAFKKSLVKAFFEARTLLQTDYFALMQQREALNAKLECEKDIASSCGRGLSAWKRQRDCLTTAIANVDRQIQPCLFD